MRDFYLSPLLRLVESKLLLNGMRECVLIVGLLSPRTLLCMVR